MPPIGLRPALDAEQLRHRRSVDVGVQHADREAKVAQGQREIDRGGGLADAAFARRHRDDGADALRRLRGPLPAMALSLGWRVGMRMRGCRRSGTLVSALPRTPFRRERHHHRLHAGHRLHGGLGGLAHRFPLRHGGGGHADRKEHLAIIGDDLRQRAAFGERLAAGRGNSCEALQDLLFRGGHRGVSPKSARVQDPRRGGLNSPSRGRSTHDTVNAKTRLTRASKPAHLRAAVRADGRA